MAAREARALTRAQRFQYFVREVLDRDEEDPLVTCLVYNGIQSIPDILALSDRTMERMKYMEEESTEKLEIRAGDIGILKAFQAWRPYLMELHDIDEIDWTDSELVSKETFDNYRINHYDPNVTSPSPKRRHTPPGNPFPLRTTQTRSPASEFQKGIRRDKSHYSVLENEDDFENWKRRTVATIFAHKLENVINKEYLPYEPEERMLLADQNTFLYDVFVSTIRTPMGQHCVRQFEGQETRGMYGSHTTII